MAARLLPIGDSHRQLRVPVGPGDRVKRQFQRRSSALGFFQLGRRCVETSDDVIKKTFGHIVEICQDFLQGAGVPFALFLIVLSLQKPSPILNFRRQQSKKSKLARAEVWRVCVLEFVLERGAFYSSFVTANISYGKAVFRS